MTATILYRIDGSRNMHRYYRLDVQQDLFGAWCLMREWGRIGQGGGQTRIESYSTPAGAETALQNQRRRKERRGYSAA
jgi:predicted DNA-binding WGR domain protein